MCTDHLEAARILLAKAQEDATRQHQQYVTYLNLRNCCNDKEHIDRVARSFYEWFHGPQADKP